MEKNEWRLILIFGIFFIVLGFFIMSKALDLPTYEEVSVCYDANYNEIIGVECIQEHYENQWLFGGLIFLSIVVMMPAAIMVGIGVAEVW